MKNMIKFWCFVFTVLILSGCAGLKQRKICTKEKSAIFTARQNMYSDKNYEKAFELAYPLAKKGCIEAQNLVGYAYHLGKGVEKDIQKAIYWYKKSAKKHNADAQSSLGHIYQYELDDYEQAIKWLTKAAMQGSKNAADRLYDIYSFGLMLYALTSIEDADKVKPISRETIKEREMHALKWAYVVREEAKIKIKGLFIVPDFEQAQKDVSNLEKSLTKEEVSKAVKLAGDILVEITENSRDKKYDRTPADLFWP